MVYGCRLSLTMAVVVLSFSASIGVIAGYCCGWRG